MVIWDDSPLTTSEREVEEEFVVVPVCPEVPPVAEYRDESALYSWLKVAGEEVTVE